MNKRRGKKGRRMKKEREKEETEEEKKKGGLASNPPFLRMRRPGPSARGKAQGIHPSARGKVLGPPSHLPLLSFPFFLLLFFISYLIPV